MAHKIKIYRDAVIGYVVTQGLYSDGISDDAIRHIDVIPIVGDTEGFFEDLLKKTIPDDAEVIGVLPAPQNTFKIVGCLKDHISTLDLGYEFEGATNPDWENDCTWRLYQSAMTFELMQFVREITYANHGEATEEMVLAAAIKSPLSVEWGADVVRLGFQDYTDAMRVHGMLKTLMTDGILDSPRKGVYTACSNPPGADQ